MGGPPKNASHREKMGRAFGPTSSSNQSSSGRSTTSSGHASMKTTSTNAKSIMSARYDGPKDSHSTPAHTTMPGLRNLEALGLSMWSGYLGVKTTTELPQRGGKFNALGREVNIGLNTFDVMSLPTKPVQQYDITIILADKGTPSRVVAMKVWRSKAVQNALGRGNWIFDGNKLAWATAQLKTTDITVDLGVEEGRKPLPKNTFRVRVAPTRQVSFTALQGFLDGRASFDISILESLALLDHLLREGPSQKYTQIKKSFFARGEQRFALGNGVEAFKGVFASVRMVMNAQRKPGLSVNVDVANGTFITQMDLLQSAIQLCRCRSADDFADLFQKSRGNWKMSNMRRYLKAYTHVSVAKKYAVKGQKEVKIDSFSTKDPYEHTFEKEKRDIQGNIIGKYNCSVAQHFKETYNVVCKRGFPLVKLTKKDLVPIECLTLLPNQRYKIKLDDKQTSNMIKFAVTLPKERWDAVQHGLRMLDWNNDPFLNAYGMKISTQQTMVKGRVLPCPEPTFANGKIDAKSASQGRWRIDGKKFLTTNTNRPLKSWGFAIVDTGRGPCVSQQQAQHFVTQFMRVYRGHGGVIVNEPCILPVKTLRGGEMISDAWNSTGNKFQAKPSILFFVVPSKDSDLYRRIKKSCECRYGVVSQVMQSSHVQKAQDQYISNVCMKVNAKLGGSTCFAVGGLSRLNPNFGKVPTMIIGADVSHAAPGDDSSGSMAAFTMSLDQKFTRYAAKCETNGHRVEIITTDNINTALGDLVKMWAHMYGGHIPQQVLYFRDGVSEGQYQFVLNQEVADMRSMFKAINPKVVPKFTVVICAKRHHVRFFPGRAGDRNENPVPGTLVETGVTHPFEFDYYLASHSAIKGTSRPVHYHVIANENDYDNQFIEQLTFEHCMQYARSTTPVSLMPPVYYAHLASNRAIAHKNEPTVSSGKKEHAEKGKNVDTLSSSDMTAAEIPPLMPLNNQNGILNSMWYI